MKQDHLFIIFKKRLKGKNLSALARELDIPKTLLHDWVAGKRAPSLKNMKYVKKVADYLGLTLSELLLGEKEDREDKEKIISSIVFEDENRSYRINIMRKIE